jgi:hypothetical protein
MSEMAHSTVKTSPGDLFTWGLDDIVVEPEIVIGFGMSRLKPGFYNGWGPRQCGLPHVHPTGEERLPS